MGPLAVAAAVAVVAALLAPIAPGRRGIAAATVVAIIAVRLMDAEVPGPLLAGFEAVSVVLVADLLLIGGRHREPRDPWLRAGGVGFTIVGLVGGAAFAMADPLYPVPVLPLAVMGGLFGAALVMLLRSDDPPAMACGAVLGLLGARLLLLHLGGALSTITELGLDLAMVGAAAAAQLSTDPVPVPPVESTPNDWAPEVGASSFTETKPVRRRSTRRPPRDDR